MEKEITKIKVSVQEEEGFWDVYETLKNESHAIRSYTTKKGAEAGAKHLREIIEALRKDYHYQDKRIFKELNDASYGGYII